MLVSSHHEPKFLAQLGSFFILNNKNRTAVALARIDIYKIISKICTVAVIKIKKNCNIVEQLNKPKYLFLSTQYQKIDKVKSSNC